jgi:hypothetical protein
MVGICAGEFCQEDDIRERGAATRYAGAQGAHEARTKRAPGARETRAPKLHLARDFLERSDVGEGYAAAPADDPARLLPCLQVLIDDLA